MKMKILILLIVTALVASKSKEKYDIIGVSSSNPNAVDTPAVSHNVVYSSSSVSIPVSLYYLLIKGLNNVQVVPFLGLSPPAARSPLQPAVEVPTEGTYYDGSFNLNKVSMQCAIVSTMTNCFKMVTCGWCSSTNLCVPGNRIGPLAPCVATSYIYSNDGLKTPMIQSPRVLPAPVNPSYPQVMFPSAQNAPVMQMMPTTAPMRQQAVDSLIANGQLKGTPGASALARELNPLNRTFLVSNPIGGFPY